jgi:hypothetical protein
MITALWITVSPSTDSREVHPKLKLISSSAFSTAHDHYAHLLMILIKVHAAVQWRAERNAPKIWT